MIHYFVSYLSQQPGGFGAGNCQIQLSRPVADMQDVSELTMLLRRNGIANPVVMAFIPLPGDGAGGTETR